MHCPTAYELSPDGLTFAVPALLSITGSPAPTGEFAAIATREDSVWTALPTAVEGNTAVAFLEHFSPYTVLPNGTTAPVVPIDASVRPGTRLRTPAPGYAVWEPGAQTVTVSGTASPDGTGRWFGGGGPGGLTQGTFPISGSSFSFSYDICANGNQLSLIGVSSNLQIDLPLPANLLCGSTGSDAGAVDGGVVDAGTTDGGTGTGGPGDLDPTFGNGGIATWTGTNVDRMTASTQDAMGRFIIVGAATGMGSDYFVARFTPDGQIDTTFGTNRHRDLQSDRFRR